MIDFIQDALQAFKPVLKHSDRKQKTQDTKYPVMGYKTYDMKLCGKMLAKNMKAKDIIGLVPTTYEETMVLGLIVAYAKCDLKDKLEALDYYFSISDIWSINDTVVAALKDSSEEYFNYLLDLLNQDVWRRRYAITAMKYNYLTDEYLDKVFDVIYNLEYGTYYVDIAVAWLLSVAFIKYRTKTSEFYENAPLPKFVLKNVVFKVKDAVRATDYDKYLIEEMYKDVLCRREI